MNLHRIAGQFLSAILVTAAFAGCGGGAAPDERPARVPVSGIITSDGSPVEGATVTFKPVGDGPGATGKTDAQGKYVLSTYEGGDGAVPGKYNVGVTKFLIDDGDAGEVDTDDESYDGGVEIEEDDDDGEDEPTPRRGKGPKNELSEEYADPENGALTAEVTEATDSLNFEL